MKKLWRSGPDDKPAYNYFISLRKISLSNKRENTPPTPPPPPLFLILRFYCSPQKPWSVSTNSIAEVILQTWARNMDHVVWPLTSELWFLLHLKCYRVFLRQKLNVISLPWLFSVAIRTRSDKQSSGWQEKGDLHIRVLRAKQPWRWMKGASPAPPRLLWRLWVHFLTYSKCSMFTDGIDELLNISLCRSNIFNGLCNGSFLLIKLSKCFLTPWAVLLGSKDIARVCFLQVDVR